MTPRETELLAWASENVRKPWERMVATAARVSAGEKLTDEQARVELPLTPFTADYRALYPLMRDFGGLITWSPNNLFTIILNQAGDKILRAYLEVTRDHSFIEMIPIDPNEPFLKKPLEIIRSKNLYGLRRCLDEACKEQLGKRVNWVKVANIDFFGAFAENMTAFEQTGDLWDWIAGAINAVKKIYQDDLIAFEPEPPVFGRMSDLFRKVLFLDTDHLDFKALFGPLRKSDSRERLIVLLKSQDLTGLSFGGADPFHLTCERPLLNKLDQVPLHLLPAAGRKLSRATRVVALRTEPVANLIYEALYHEMPYGREDTKQVLRKLLEIVRRFREQWSMSPLPFYLHDHWRLPAKWLGNPFDINYLAAWFLPGMIVDGEQVILGQHNQRTFVTLDGSKILAIYMMEFYDGGIRRLVTLDPAKYADVFAELKPEYSDARQRAEDLGHRLWKEGHGFQNQVMVMQKDFLTNLGAVGSLRTWKSIFLVWRAIGPARRLFKSGKRGGIVSYPDQAIFALERWIQKVGRVKIYRSLITIPFDRKRPRSRGRQYIGFTVGLVVFATAALLLYLL
jgi:hypothetical protein